MRRLVLPLLALSVAGCMDNDGKYPSLLPRAIESQSLVEPERPMPVATPDPALDARIAEITTALDGSAKAFVSAAQKAEALVAVARGVPEGSDAWLDAQTGLGTLDAAHAPTGAAIADLEQLATDRGQAGLPGYPALDAALAHAQAVDAAQTKRIAGLEAALRGED